MEKTMLSLLAHVRNWSVITNTERIDIKAIFFALWNNFPNQHINTYVCQLDRRQ